MADVWPDDPLTPATPTQAWPNDPLVVASGEQWPDDPLVGAPSSMGMLGYPAEIVKAGIRGAAGGAATTLRGIGARQAPHEPILGQSLDESVAGAAMQGRLPQVIQAPGTGTVRPIQETGPYQAGEALEAAAAQRFPSTKTLHPFVEDVAGAVGQVGANIATSMVPAIGLPASIAGIIAQGSGEAAERAVKAKATPEQADLATSLGVIPGATEYADLLLPKLGGVGQALSLLKRVGAKAFIGFAGEGLQEAAQEFIQNAIEKGVYNPKKELGENVLYSGLVGGVAGGLVGGAMPGRREAAGAQPAPTLEATPEEAYAASIEPIIQPQVEPAVAGVDVSGAMRTQAPAPVVTPSIVETVKEMGTPPQETATTSQEPSAAATADGLYKGTFTPKEVQTNLTRNLQRLINYNLALSDPEVQRNPDQIAHIHKQLQILQSEIIAQRQFLGITAPQEQQPQLLLPPPAITPAERAAGLEAPPVHLGPSPIVVGVPEEVNHAAAQVEILPPLSRPQAPLDVVLERPLNLDDEQVRTAAANFGLLRYSLFDPGTETIHTTSAFNISPDQGSTGTRLRVSQDEISPRNVVVHSNTAVSPVGGPLTPGGPRVDIVEAATAKFGQRFHSYIYALGAQLRTLRDVVAGLPPLITAERYPGVPTDFVGLLSEGVGVSFDPRYHGVNIKVPVAMTFINPATLKYTDPDAAAKGLFHTMVHELSHHVHRTEHRIEDVIAEMIGRLQEIPTFDAVGFKNGLRDTIASYHDVALWLRGLYEDGNVEPIGRPLPVGQGRGRGSIGNVRNLTERTGTPWGSTLSDWAAVSASGASGVRDSGRGGAKTKDVGGYAGRADYGRGANQRAINREVGHSGVTADQQTPETQGARQAIGTILSGDAFQAVAAQAAHADHINWLYKWMGSLLDLVQRNINFTPLVRYAELARLWHMQESQIQDAAATIAKRWRGLGNVQSDALARVLDDEANMTYLTPAERAAGVVRKPTATEHAALLARHGVNAAGRGVYADVNRFFSTFLRLTAQNAQDAARRTITDPIKLSDALNEIAAWITTLEKRPYFPFLRFGSHYIRARDARGNLVFFNLYERRGVLSAKQNRDRALKQVQAQYPTATIDIGVMPEDVRPLYGMPPSLLKLIHQKMNLTQVQREVLEQLQFQMSPEMSFKHRFQHKSYTPGYSKDFIRAFSHYAFHGARYYAKTKYVWDMEDQVKAARSVGGDKATRIANFMDDHLAKTLLDIKGDHGLLKGFAFNWHLAFMPSSAFVNLTQTPLVTGPFLGNKFGDTRAIRALTNAMRKATSYYRKGSYQGTHTEFEMKALSVGMKWGIVSETQASEVASLANGNGLLHGVGGTQAQQMMQWFQQKGAMMFEAAEQFNRRIAFRAALELAQNDPNSKYVTEAMKKNPTLYNDLINGLNTGRAGRFSPQEAQAIVTAFDVVEQTQFVYSRFARPRFMRGKWSGAIFVFQRYNQGVLFALLNGDRGYRLRYLLTAAALGGLSGLMGFDELKDLFEGIFKRMGYNVNVESEIRKYVKQFSGSPEAADYILHGFARRGFGIPHILDGLGSFATGRPGRGLLDPPHMGNVNVPAPMLDMSKAITPKLSPIEWGKLIAPYQDPKKLVADQGQKAAGAVFSPGFNIFKALIGSKEEFEDTKRWEKAVPRVVAGVSKTFRAFTEGRERFGSAAPNSARTLVKYDVRDTEQMMEVIFRGMGFNPLRESREWDFTRANLEHKQFVEGTRKALMEQMFEATKTQDPKDKEAAISDIRKFNERVRGTEDRAYAITADNLLQSIRSRARELATAEAGLSGRKREIPVIQELRGLYPRAVEIQRR